MKTLLPQKRVRQRSGILRAPARKYPRHEKWVRGHSCSIAGCENGPIEFAHVRSAANAGMGLKPSSAYGVSLCAAHHAESHRIGVDTFQRLYNINLWTLAETFVILSPDVEMKASLQGRIEPDDN